MRPFCSIRDPVHDFIGLNELECRIVNAAVFQRLRGIHQLAMAFLVYPGALHTRFDHSLGVCHIAGALAENIDLGDEETRLVRLAALLHDIGHGPFSHVSENSLERFADRPVLKGKLKSKEKIHELLTLDVIDEDAEIKEMLSNRDRRTIKKLLSKGHGEPILRDIISGPLDADKQDYLLRDSLFCGVRYGVFDLAQMLRSLMAGKDGEDTCLMVKETGVHSLEQFVLAKYYLTTQVYRHRVRLITDAMLTRAVAAGILVDELDEMKRLYSYDGTPGFIQNYVSWDDARFLREFGSDKYNGKVAHEIVQRLQQRRLLKAVFVRDLNERNFPEPEIRLNLLGISDEAKTAIESRIAELLSDKWNRTVDRNLVVLNIHSIKSVREQSRDEEKPILVDGRPAPTPFEEKSTLFRSIDEAQNDSFVEVYAPAEYETDADRRSLLKGLDNSVLEAIQLAVKGNGDNDENT